MYLSSIYCMKKRVLVYKNSVYCRETATDKESSESQTKQVPLYKEINTYRNRLTRQVPLYIERYRNKNQVLLYRQIQVQDPYSRRQAPLYKGDSDSPIVMEHRVSPGQRKREFVMRRHQLS